MSSIREALEQRERETLAPQAAKSADSRGRLTPEPEDDVRPAFQHDRDRIIHSKAFRRLKHKTQVFFAPAGDHYRTRLTHTLEVSQIARTIAKVLRCTRSSPSRSRSGTTSATRRSATPASACSTRSMPGGFRHYEQSLRIVDVLENDGRGLNLTWEVRDGIGRHSKGKDGSPVGVDPSKRAATLEGQIMRVADLIAYVNHDIDDAVRAGVLKEADLPQDAGRRARRDLVGPHRAHGQGRRHRDAGRRAQRDSHERARCSRRRWRCGRSCSTPSTRTRSRPPSSRRPPASSAVCGRRSASGPDEFLDRADHRGRGARRRGQGFPGRHDRSVRGRALRAALHSQALGRADGLESAIIDGLPFARFSREGCRHAA